MNIFNLDQAMQKICPNCNARVYQHCDYSDEEIIHCEQCGKISTYDQVFSYMKNEVNQ